MMVGGGGVRMGQGKLDPALNFCLSPSLSPSTADSVCVMPLPVPPEMVLIAGER